MRRPARDRQRPGARHERRRAAASRGAGRDPPGRHRQGRGPDDRRPCARGRRAPTRRFSVKAIASRPNATRRRNRSATPSAPARGPTAPRSPSSAGRRRMPAVASTRSTRSSRRVEAELGRAPPPHPQPGGPGRPDRRQGCQPHGPHVGRPPAEDSPRSTAAHRHGSAGRTGRSASGSGMFDLARGAKIAGSGFPVYTGAGSALQRALIDFFLDTHTREHGLTEIWPPALVNTASATGTGQIPDKEDQMYVVTRDDLYLVPTAEVPVTNLHRDEILDAGRAAHPLRRLLAMFPARGRRGRRGHPRHPPRPPVRQGRDGLLREARRDHRRPSRSSPASPRRLLQRLELPYRVLLMATGDMGFVQAKKYDLEVWSPGVEDWLEVSSCSNFRDYQARRMAIRYRPEPGARPELVHTLNGSGLALARVVRRDPRDLPAARRLGRRPDRPAIAHGHGPDRGARLGGTVNLDLRLPAGTRLVTLAERPRPHGADERATTASSGRHSCSRTRWRSPLGSPRRASFAAYQLLLLDSDGRDRRGGQQRAAVVGRDGRDDLPAGWDDQFERTIAQATVPASRRTRSARSRSSLHRAARGSGLSAGHGRCVSRARPRRAGFGAVIACVRPTPEDALSADADGGLRRVAARGRSARSTPGCASTSAPAAEIVRVSPQSMTIGGTARRLARHGPGQEFPVSGPYWVEGAPRARRGRRHRGPRPRTSTPTCGSSTGCSRDEVATRGCTPPPCRSCRFNGRPRRLAFSFLVDTWPRAKQPPWRAAAEPADPAACRRRYSDRAAERWPSG